MRLFLKKDVLTASLERIHRIFDEFDNLCVSFSGGKDSTVVLDLVKRVARERGRLPQKVMFLDQEAEWESTVEYMRYIMSDPEVEPYWFQVPFRLFNSASFLNVWFHVWDTNPDVKWIREKEPNSIKENKLGVDRFYDMLDAMHKSILPAPSACFVGIRAEESPGRAMGLTQKTYKDITWGSVIDAKTQRFTFHPIYDWSYSDIWHHIHINNLRYNSLYDKMYSMGYAARNMRVSSVCHEMSVKALIDLSEIEPDTWKRISHRIAGANTVKVLKGDTLGCPDKLPYMFKDWVEYRDFLFEKLVEDDNKELFGKNLRVLNKFMGTDLELDAIQAQIGAIIRGDVYCTVLKNFISGSVFGRANKHRRTDI